MKDELQLKAHWLDSLATNLPASKTASEHSAANEIILLD